MSIDRGIDRLERWRNSKEGQRAEGNLRGQRARGGVEKLLTRTTSGAIYAIVVVGCFLLGHISTAFLVAAMRRLRPELVSCPTCGRTEVDLIAIAEEVEDRLRCVRAPITVAVMESISGPVRKSTAADSAGSSE